MIVRESHDRTRILPPFAMPVVKPWRSPTTHAVSMSARVRSSSSRSARWPLVEFIKATSSPNRRLFFSSSRRRGNPMGRLSICGARIVKSRTACDSKGFERVVKDYQNWSTTLSLDRQGSAAQRSAGRGGALGARTGSLWASLMLILT